MTIDPSQRVEGDLPRGSARLVARFVDTALVLVVFAMMRSVIDDGFGEAPSLAVSVTTLLFALAYEIGMVAARGATIGKIAMGLCITDEAGNAPPSVRVAAMRWLPNLVAIVPIVGPIIVLALLLASTIWIFTDDLRRSIFDKAGQTRVVSLR